MLVLFEVYVASGTEHEDLLSQEVLDATAAQVMTPDEASKLGFQGLESIAVPPNMALRLVIVAAKDKTFISSRLEANPTVGNYRAHEIST